MEPGGSFQKDLYHPINSRLLLSNPPVLKYSEMKYLYLIIIDYLITTIPNTIRYIKGDTFKDFENIYKYSNISKDSIFERMRNNANKAEMFYETAVFIPATILHIP